MWASAHPVLRAGALLAWLLTAGLGAVLNKGGIIQEQRRDTLATVASNNGSTNGVPASDAVRV